MSNPHWELRRIIVRHKNYGERMPNLKEVEKALDYIQDRSAENFRLRTQYRRGLWKAAKRLAAHVWIDPGVTVEIICPAGERRLTHGVLDCYVDLSTWPACKDCSKKSRWKSLYRLIRCWFLWLLGAKNVRNVWKEARK